MNDEIKPCPFCGGEGILEQVNVASSRNEPQYYIVCRCCACEGGWHKTKSGAARHWNRRVGETTTEAAGLRHALISIRKDVPYAHTTVDSPGKWDTLCEEVKCQVDDVTPNGTAGAQVLSELAEARRKLADVDTERLALRAALEPFARFQEAYDKGYALQAKRDEDVVYQFNDATITLGDLRWAAETLKKGETR